MSKYPPPFGVARRAPAGEGARVEADQKKPPERDAAIERLTKYQRLLCVTDSISGMTDGFAVELFQRLSGIKLST